MDFFNPSSENGFKLRAVKDYSNPILLCVHAFDSKGLLGSVGPPTILTQ